MDILKPELYEIGGRVYCNYNNKQQQSYNDYNSDDDEDYDERAAYDDYNNYDDGPSCKQEVVDERIQQLDNGTYSIKLSIPSAFFKHIYGVKGKVKNEIENATKARIKVPGKGIEGDIVITGPSRRSVESASSRVELLVDSKRWKEPFTHFVSISVASEEVKQNLLKFKHEVMENFATSEGMDASIFQRPGRIHMTICTLVLLNDAEEVKARNVLEQCREAIISEILENKSLKIVIEGLEYMNDDPSAVDVLYAKVICVDDSDALQKLADRITAEYVAAGLCKKEYERVKLHVTLINTKYRREDENQVQVPTRSRFRQARETFSATSILNHHLGYYFGKVQVDKVHISVSGAKKDPTGYYQSIGTIDLC